MLFERNDIEFGRGEFRVRVMWSRSIPAYLDEHRDPRRVLDDVNRSHHLDPTRLQACREIVGQPHVCPCQSLEFVTPGDKMKRAAVEIREEADGQVSMFEKEGKLIEAQRLRMRTDYDLEMMRGNGVLPGNRELLAPPDRPRAGRQAAHSVRFLPRAISS